MMMLFLGQLLNKDTPQIQHAYNKQFPEPIHKDSLLHIIWQCTRANPEERMTIDALIIKYQQWAQRMQQRIEQGDVKSIEETF